MYLQEQGGQAILARGRAALDKSQAQPRRPPCGTPRRTTSAPVEAIDRALPPSQYTPEEKEAARLERQREELVQAIKETPMQLREKPRSASASSGRSTSGRVKNSAFTKVHRPVPRHHSTSPSIAARSPSPITRKRPEPEGPEEYQLHQTSDTDNDMQEQDTPPESRERLPGRVRGTGQRETPSSSHP